MNKPKFYRYGKHKSLSDIKNIKSINTYWFSIWDYFEYSGYLVDAFKARIHYAKDEKRKHGDVFSNWIIASMHKKSQDYANAD